MEVSLRGDHDDGGETVESQIWVSEVAEVGRQVDRTRFESTARVGVPLPYPLGAGSFVDLEGPSMCVVQVPFESGRFVYGVGAWSGRLADQQFASSTVTEAEQRAAGLEPVGAVGGDAMDQLARLVGYA